MKLYWENEPAFILLDLCDVIKQNELELSKFLFLDDEANNSIKFPLYF